MVELSKTSLWNTILLHGSLVITCPGEPFFSVKLSRTGPFTFPKEGPDSLYSQPQSHPNPIGLQFRKTFNFFSFFENL